jgi:DNA-binding response OmpR family regulator
VEKVYDMEERMEGQKILIVEDDADISGLLVKIMEGAGYQVRQAFSGTEALFCMERELPDCVLLDLMLPGMTGEAVLDQIRQKQKKEMPVLILSAKVSVQDKVKLLRLGADDYITKPFDPEEVIARVEAAIRRYTKEAQNMEAEQEVFRYKNLNLYPQSRKVEVSGIELPLTMHEYDILYLLIQNPQKVYSREHLYEQVWKGGYYGEDNTVNVHVSNLRKKIQKADKEESYIKTVWGIGFKLE